MSHPLNDLVWCKIAPSPIHGVGIFAIRDIPKGTELAGGEYVYRKDEEETLLPEIRALIQDHYSHLELMSIMPNPNRDAYLQCFMNHSDDANSDGHHALRDIAKGEEVTENYKKLSRPLGEAAHEYFKAFI